MRDRLVLAASSVSIGVVIGLGMPTGAHYDVLELHRQVELLRGRMCLNMMVDVVEEDLRFTKSYVDLTVKTAHGMAPGDFLGFGAGYWNTYNNLVVERTESIRRHRKEYWPDGIMALGFLDCLR